MRLEKRSGGTWKPSPGSIYPTLHYLGDEDLVTSEIQEGKRIYALTELGRTTITERQNQGEATPWATMTENNVVGLRDAVRAIGMAAKPRRNRSRGLRHENGRTFGFVEPERRVLGNCSAPAVLAHVGKVEVSRQYKPHTERGEGLQREVRPAHRAHGLEQGTFGLHQRVVGNDDAERIG